MAFASPVRPFLALLLLAGALPAAELTVYGTTIPAGATGAVALTWQGRARSALVHVPSGFRAGLPVVMVLHGGSGTAAVIETSSGWSAKADAVGCLAVYPQGLSLDAAGNDDPANETSYWANDRGTRPDQFGIDDVGFIDALAAGVVAAGGADPDRVYAMGISNGGMMVHRLGRDRARTWAALSSVSGSLTATPSVTPFAPAAPVPVLLFHGTSDTVVPYAGGTVLGQGGPVLGAVETCELWWRADRCAAAGTVTDLPDLAADGCTAQRVDYLGGEAGTRVALVTIAGGNHSWPGSAGGSPGAGAGAKTMDFQATAVAWEFFAPLRRRGELALARGAVAVATGTIDACGTVAPSAAVDVVYTIVNRGSGALALGPPQLGPTSACTASVAQAPPATLAAGASADFTVRVVVAGDPWQTAINLASDDLDEPATSWIITGSAPAPAEAGSTGGALAAPAAAMAPPAGGGSGSCGLGGMALALTAILALGRRPGRR